LKGNGQTRVLLIASDVDGCLLDEQTYSSREADQALAALRASGTPLVLCSSKTQAEMELLVSELGLPWPYAVENGGAIVVPAGTFRPGIDPAVVTPVGLVELGTARDTLVRELHEIALETGAAVIGFSTLQPSDVVRLTGLSPDRAARALQRRYDEPFLLQGDGTAVAAAAAHRGLRVTRGARFLHLTGPVDKGDALRRLLGMYAADGRRFETIGLGDAPNDLALLRAVDRPVVVPRPSGLDPDLAAALPHAERAPRPGPFGWACAVIAALEGRRLPRVRAAAVGRRAS
jgi:mannosyl-3-phosphoglycerate phosphatase